MSTKQVHTPPSAGGEPGGVTRMRNESKFSVRPELLPAVLSTLAEHMTVQRTTAESRPIATFYFDDGPGTHLSSAREADVSLRLRLREYPQPDGGHEHWIEVKRNAGPTSDKRRVLVPIADVPLIFEDPFEAGRRFRALAAELGKAPLHAVLAICYQRDTFQEDGCRVTVDRGVTFYRPPRQLRVPLGQSLRDPVRTEPDATLEIKTTVPERDWMRALRKQLAPQQESKFVRGSMALGRR